MAKVQQRRAELYHQVWYTGMPEVNVLVVQWRDTLILSLIFICESLPFIVGSYSALRDCSARCQSLPLVASAFLGTGASLSALKCASESAMVSLFNVLWGSASLFCSLYAGICLLSSSDCSPFEKSIGAFIPVFPAFGTLHAAAPELRVAVGDSIKDYVKEEKLRQSQRKAYNRNDNRSRIHRMFFNLLLKTKSGEEGVLLYREEMASRRGRPEFRAMRTNPSLPTASQPALVHGSSSILPDGMDARMSIDASRNTGAGDRISGVGQALKERINNMFSTKAQDN
ncbi:hypothetical protein FOL47_008170 [Perkinsus chesapeaki]|uniref:Uncharacterized protein n=1 Tax=Perkinsus chesapeaki TaxID=330153 RepID=A0A7J6MUC2_PERCH|nr:hypothetical protein FOL47_008170 [Perkinsus chesapeaki]